MPDENKKEVKEVDILKQGFKMGATAAFVAANYPIDDITDELLENMFQKVLVMWLAKHNPQK